MLAWLLLPAGVAVVGGSLTWWEFAKFRNEDPSHLWGGVIIFGVTAIGVIVSCLIAAIGMGAV